MLLKIKKVQIHRTTQLSDCHRPPVVKPNYTEYLFIYNKI